MKNEMISLKEAAAILDVHITTVYRMVKIGRISVYTPRGKIRGRQVRRAEIEEISGTVMSDVVLGVEVLRLSPKATTSKIISFIACPPKNAQLLLRWTEDDGSRMELDLAPISTDIAWTAFVCLIHPEQIIRNNSNTETNTKDNINDGKETE